MLFRPHFPVQLHAVGGEERQRRALGYSQGATSPSALHCLPSMCLALMLCHLNCNVPSLSHAKLPRPLLLPPCSPPHPPFCFPSLLQLFAEELDSDGDGALDANEARSLVALAQVSVHLYEGDAAAFVLRVVAHKTSAHRSTPRSSSFLSPWRGCAVAGAGTCSN